MVSARTSFSISRSTRLPASCSADCVKVWRPERRPLSIWLSAFSISLTAPCHDFACSFACRFASSAAWRSSAAKSSTFFAFN